MTTKTDIKKILSKGLTGKEAGKLILEDSWLYDHGKGDFLSDRDIQAIKASLKTTKDIEDYNSYVETYRILDYTLKDAHIKALEAEVRIGALQSLMYLYLFDSSSELDYLNTPVIMTEKQYQESKARQREMLLKETHSIRDILSDRAKKLYPDRLAEFEKSEANFLIDFLNEYYLDESNKTISEILDLLRSGQLQPVSLPEKAVQKLKDLYAKEEQARARIPLNQMSKEELQERIQKRKWPPRDRQAEQELQKLYKEYEKAELTAYQTAKSKYSQESLAKIISMLEQLLDNCSLSVEDQVQILDYTYCSGEDLYQAGLPEWIEWIDEYKPGYDDRDDKASGSGVAILLNPSSRQLDERGYFKGHKRRLDIKEQSGELDMPEGFLTGLRKLKEELKIVLSFSSVVEAVSETIGIDFAEDTRGWIQSLKETIDELNDLIERAEYLPSVPDSLKDVLKPIDFDQFRPSAKTTKYLKERLALSLGEGWWPDAKKALLEDLKEKEALHGQEA